MRVSIESTCASATWLNMNGPPTDLLSIRINLQLREAFDLVMRRPSSRWSGDRKCKIACQWGEGGMESESAGIMVASQSIMEELSTLISLFGHAS